MTKLNDEAIEKYQKILLKDPTSKAFAALAEAYRERGKAKEAEAVARKGLRHNAEYVSGYVALARALMDQDRIDEALPVVQKATQFDPENILALQLLGACHLYLQNTKSALKAFKMVLFLNPQSEKARKAVEKLETLTAADFDEDVFSMKPLKPLSQAPHDEDEQRSSAEEMERQLEQQLSMFDALLVRNEIPRASYLLRELAKMFPSHPGVLKRESLLKETGNDQDYIELEQTARNKKIEFLRSVLKRINSYKEAHS